MLERNPSFCLEPENAPSFPNASNGVLDKASEDSLSRTEIMIGNRVLKLSKSGIDSGSSKDLLEQRKVQGQVGIGSFYDRIGSDKVFDVKSEPSVMDLNESDSPVMQPLKKVKDLDEYVRRPTNISFQDMQIKFETDKSITEVRKLNQRRSGSVDI